MLKGIWRSAGCVAIHLPSAVAGLHVNHLHDIMIYNHTRSKAPKIDFAVSNHLLTGSARLALVASWLDLPCQLARRVRLKLRCRGCADEQMLLSLIYSLCAGGGHLSAVDSLQYDRARAAHHRLASLRAAC